MKSPPSRLLTLRKSFGTVQRLIGSNVQGEDTFEGLPTSQTLKHLFMRLFGRGITITDRKSYTSFLQSLPHTVLNVICTTLTFVVDNSQYSEYDYVRAPGPYRYSRDPLPYFIGTHLTRRGLLANLHTVHVKYFINVSDPYCQLFPLTLPRTVKVLRISYRYPSHYDLKSIHFHQGLFWRHTPIRFPRRRPRLEILDISGVYEAKGLEITQVWESLFEGIRLLKLNGATLSPGVDTPFSISLDDALDLARTERHDMDAEAILKTEEMKEIVQQEPRRYTPELIDFGPVRVFLTPAVPITNGFRKTPKSSILNSATRTRRRRSSFS